MELADQGQTETSGLVSSLARVKCINDWRYKIPYIEQDPGIPSARAAVRLLLLTTGDEYCHSPLVR